MAQNATDKKGTLGGLFDDLSLPQVIAGALAAVTSMLLASQIGIYGSVIGVGVGSVVSAVASQLYKKFLQRSAEKLRELKPGESGFGQQEAGVDGRAGAGLGEGDTVSLEPVSGLHEGTPTPSLEDASMQSDATVRRVRAEREHKKKVQRGVVIVSVVSAVLAVLISGAVVYLATQGEGVGAKTNPIVSAVRQSPSKATDDGSSSSAEGDEGSSSSGSSAGSSDGKSGTGGSKGSSDGTSSGSGDGGQQGSGSTGSGSASGSDSGQSGGSPSSGGTGGTDSGSGTGSGSSSSGSSGSGSGGSSDSSGSGGTSGSGPSGSGSGGASGTSGSEDASGSSASGASGGSSVAAQAPSRSAQAAA